MDAWRRTVRGTSAAAALALGLGLATGSARAQLNAYRDPLLGSLDTSLVGRAVTGEGAPEWKHALDAGLGAVRAGRPREAELLYFRALELATNPLHRAMTLTNLGDLYTIRRRTDWAARAYNEAIQSWEQSVGAAHPALALSLNNLAALYLSERRPAEAQREYRRALTILTRELGPESAPVATVLSNLGCACRMGRQAEEAEKCFRQALEIREKRDPKDVAVALVVNNLAQLRAEQGNAEEAQPLFERALSIWEKRLGANHSMVAIGLQTYGDFLHSRGKDDQAAPLYERALGILERGRGYGHFELLPSLQALGEVYTELERYSDADRCFVRAVQMTKELLGPNHPGVADILERYALLQQKSGRPNRATETWREVARLRELAGLPTTAAVPAGLAGQ